MMPDYTVPSSTVWNLTVTAKWQASRFPDSWTVEGGSLLRNNFFSVDDTDGHTKRISFSFFGTRWFGVVPHFFFIAWHFHFASIWHVMVMCFLRSLLTGWQVTKYKHHWFSDCADGGRVVSQRSVARGYRCEVRLARCFTHLAVNL